MKDLAALLPLAVIALLFWLLVLRPAQRRQAKLRGMQQELHVGSRVMVAAGIHGTVRSIQPADGSGTGSETIGLEVADGVVLTVARAAVVEILDPTGNEVAPVSAVDEVSANEGSIDFEKRDGSRD